MNTLRVSDMKQWFYCPRVVYWTRTVAIERPVTRKMEYGRESHDILDRLEQRRTFQRYGLEPARRVFHLSLCSETLGLSGTLDLCLETPTGPIPVEFKDSLGGMRQNHVAQLTAYALLLEEQYGCTVPAGFWVSAPREEVRRVPLSDAWKARVRKGLEEMRGCIQKEVMPSPADRWEKCEDCEFLRFCGDRYEEGE